MGTYYRSGIAILLTSAAVILPAIPAMAVPFTQRYTTNARGEIKFVSNTIATCSPLRVTSSRSDSTGGNAILNDIITYRFTITNDAATLVNNLRLESLIPTGMIYVPNSLKIGTTSLTDAANDDGAEVSGSNINFRFGTGATSLSGGSFIAGESNIIEFKLKVNTTGGNIVTPAIASYTEGSGTSAVNIRIPISRTITIGSNATSGTGAGSTDSTNATNCSSAKTGSAFPNNDFNLAYIDVDSDSSTFNSSQSTLSLPADAVVLYAGLYWGGSSLSTDRGSVKFAGPNGTYTNISSDTLYSGAATAYTSSYQGFKNVTTEVQTGGAGVYTVGNIQTDSGASNLWGGWSLVVVYGSSTERPRNLTIYDGYLSVSGTGTATIDINGFITPPNGTVKAKIGAIVYDGDDGVGYTGDKASVQRTTGTPPVVVGTAKFLGGGVNPNDNIFNSTISSLGVNITSKSPNYLNQLGYDADIYDANGVLVNGDTSARITLSTGGETYAPGVITSSIDLFVPVIDLGKSFVDLNGGNLEPGDILEYTIVVTNNKDADGNGDPANKNVVTDPIPANTTYVPGSLTINGVAKTDAVGDDTADFDDTSTPKKTIFRIGAGATATTGGTLAINTATKAAPSAPSTSTVKFRVKVNASVPDNTDITNIAASSYTGATLGEGKSIAAASPGVTIKTDNSSISGTLYKDNNLDSIYNTGEPLLPAGIKVTLYKDLNGNGTIDLVDLIVSEVDTDANGKYTFLDIPNGSYIIRVDTTDPQIPTGKLLITPNNLTATVAGLPVIDRHFGFTPDPAAGNPNLLLVKRITKINSSTTTSGGGNLAIYEHQSSNPYDDNVINTPAVIPPDTDKWPIANGFPFMIGAVDGGNVKPNDSIEYTIYFLSAGTSTAKNVLFCDRVPANVTFSPNAFTNTIANPTGVARGIAVSSGNTLNYYTNAGDTDPARYFPPGIEPSTVYPNINCGKNATGQVLLNDNGAVVVNLGDRPNALGTTADAAAGAYGFVRFQGVVK
jgi:uncharacterized repeat protein (TIGR01451 family)